MPKHKQPPKPEPHKLAFVDIETTSLSPHQGEIWEIGLIIDKVDEHGDAQTMHEALYYPQVENLGAASSKSLQIGRYYDRRLENSISRSHGWSGDVWYGHAPDAAGIIAPKLVGCRLVGCTVQFDAEWLNVWLRKHNQCPMFDYHLIDATVYAAGAKGLRPPWKSNVVAEAYGIALQEEDAHCALNDARLARDLYYTAQAFAAAGRPQ